MSVQSTIQSRLPELPASARRVAQAIVKDPELVLQKTITELAQLCDTSETSVVRFCRSIGMTGYVQLRIALATELGREAAQMAPPDARGADLLPSDGLSEIVRKIAFAETKGIEETAAGIDMNSLQAAVAAISAAPKVLLFGVGASRIGAGDLAQKLLRIGRTALTFADAHDAMVSAALLGEGDVAIGFSHSGRTEETLHFARSAGRNGATTIAITNGSGSSLGAAADIALFTAVRETELRSGAMASRIAQLTLVDILFVAVAQGNHAQAVEALDATYDAVADWKNPRR
ncbi:MurR/RpiR family transcriptional regulator [Saxibacter everestensis]|uniref:MurR/RpiR family transcriptional regulator n=1 Tax=Saxibacter everestensis TaxID=2909229 RepID=A0ABY8QY15_9MICO|nr:MurR/RpiR family transcriptional regulator [Brevibacteriaceae bacterium ZFBP1038]